MSVHRLTLLPTSKNRGRLIVTVGVAEQTRLALRRSSGSDGRHEGLVFWGGRRADNDTVILTSLIPNSNHGRQHVMAAPDEVGRLSRMARSLGLVVAAQVHSHPGEDTRHSDGDDRLVLMPYEGMFSLVIANYGDGGIHPQQGSGLHQFQDGRWCKIEVGCHDAMLIVPDTTGV
jgi:proteasome lid subunit RPN8/RPN11